MTPKEQIPDPDHFKNYWEDEDLRIVEDTEDENEPSIGDWIREREIEEN